MWRLYDPQSVCPNRAVSALCWPQGQRLCRFSSNLFNLKVWETFKEIPAHVTFKPCGGQWHLSLTPAWLPTEATVVASCWSFFLEISVCIFSYSGAGTSHTPSCTWYCSVNSASRRSLRICLWSTLVVHVWITHFLFWGTIRLFPANFTVYKPLLSVCVCFYVYGQLCLRGEVSGEFTVHVPFWMCWASPAYPHFREVVPIDVSLHFYLIRYCVLELGDLSMWEVKILLHYGSALYFYWVVYLLIFKSPLYVKEINSVICATNTFLFVLGL